MADKKKKKDKMEISVAEYSTAQKDWQLSRVAINTQVKLIYLNRFG